jgi:hypothetical protein
LSQLAPEGDRDADDIILGHLRVERKQDRMILRQLGLAQAEALLFT